MKVRRIKLLLIISLLVFGMVGGVSIVAAAENSFNPGYATDPDFFSHSWAPAKYTSSYSDPDFFSSNWKPAKITYSFADPDFFSSNWTVPTYKPSADANFLYSNWSVKTPVLFRYSGIDSTRTNNYNLDPFASDDELRAQGWDIKGDFWQAWN
jgi:hypothetical protein